MPSKTYDNEYSKLLRGYEVTLFPNMENPGYYTVSLSEKGSEVFKQDIPNSSQDPDELEEETLNDIAQAAIDIYESAKGTLGLGAGAEPPKGPKKARKTMKKLSYLSCDSTHEEWFMNLKGTVYEQQAYELFSRYLDAGYTQERDSETVDSLYAKCNDIEYQMKKLDLERMKSMPAATQIIIIQGKKRGYEQPDFTGGDLDSLSESIWTELRHREEDLNHIVNSYEGFPGIIQGELEAFASNFKIEGVENADWKGIADLAISWVNNAPTQASKNRQGKKEASLWEVEIVQDYLDKFIACPLESQAVKLVKQYIEVKEELNQAFDLEDDRWAEMQEIEGQMEALSLEALYVNVIDKIPTEGMEAFPNMAADVAEMMEGVSLEPSLMDNNPATVLARKKAQYSQSYPDAPDPKFQVGDMVSESDGSRPGKITFVKEYDEYQGTWKYRVEDEAGSQKIRDEISLKLARKKAFEEVEPVEDRIQELGEYHEGIDIAEVDYPDNATWNNGDRVQLKKELEVPSWAGKKKFKAGTKGVIDELFDKGNQIYLVALEDKNGKITLAKIPGKELKKRSK